MGLVPSAVLAGIPVVSAMMTDDNRCRESGALGYYRQQSDAFAPLVLKMMRGHILASPYLGINNLNRDFVGTRGFSVVFRRSSLPLVAARFGYLRPYLEQVLLPECQAYYLNALLLVQGSRVDPHIDRSLRSYCKIIQPPAWVSVLYLQVPAGMQGGALVLQRGQRWVARLQPVENTLVYFQGDLTHGVERMQSEGVRLSLVCEQYVLDPEEERQIPEWTVESRQL